MPIFGSSFWQYSRHWVWRGNEEEHMKSGAYLLVAGLAGVEGMFLAKFMLLLDRSSVGIKDTFTASIVT